MADPATDPVAARRPVRRAGRGSAGVGAGATAWPRGEPLLHVLTQPLILDQLRRLRSPRNQLRFPLRNRRPIVQLPAASGSVAAQLPRDRRRVAAQSASDFPNPSSLGFQLAIASIVHDYGLGRGRDEAEWRFARLSAELGLDRDRARGWAFARTLVQAFQDDAWMDQHIETARWLLAR
jgi:hypothetical protein